MACELTGGIALGCKNFSGGIRSLFIANFDQVATINSSPVYVDGTSGVSGFSGVTGGTTDPVISAITMQSGGKFYRFFFLKDAVTIDQNTTVNLSTGTNTTTQTITIKFAKIETDKRNKLKIMAQAKLMVIAQDFNGQFWVFGEVDGVDLTENKSAFGTKKTDENGYTVTLMGEEPAQAREFLKTDYATTLTWLEDNSQV